MKKLTKLILIILILSSPIIVFGDEPIIPKKPTLNELMFEYEQNIQNKTKYINLHLKYGIGSDGTGAVMIVGGAAFLLGGILTDPDRKWNGSEWKDQQFFGQGPRTYAILSGVGLIIGGTVFSINNM
jgi:hypothetical protein